jgi:hypothetical protein
MVVSEAGGTWGEASQIIPPLTTTDEAGLLSVVCPVLGSCVAVGQYTANSAESDYEAMVVTGGPQSTDGTPPPATGGSTTSASSPTAATPIAIAPAQASPARMSLLSRSVTVQGGDAVVKLSCKIPPGCSGTLTLGIKTTTGKGKHKRAHCLAIGKTSFSIPRGTTTIKVKLTRTGRAWLRSSRGRLKASLTIRQTIASHPIATITGTVRLVEHAAEMPPRSDRNVPDVKPQSQPSAAESGTVLSEPRPRSMGVRGSGVLHPPVDANRSGRRTILRRRPRRSAVCSTRCRPRRSRFSV